MKIQVTRVSENTLIVYFGDHIDTKLIDKIAQFTREVQQQYARVIYDVIPSYTSVLIEYNPLAVDIETFRSWCQKQAELALTSQTSDQGKVVVLPVYYHPDVAPDLLDLAKQKSLSVEQVIEIHSQQEYTVCAIGFAPGFAFLGSVDPRITAPRHAQPRLKVPQGSVGIADQQTAVYPLETPGGWQIIGNCPATLFDMNNTPMMPFEVGDKVHFESINREQYIELGGVL